MNFTYKQGRKTIEYVEDDAVAYIPRVGETVRVYDYRALDGTGPLSYGPRKSIEGIVESVCREVQVRRMVQTYFATITIAKKT